MKIRQPSLSAKKNTSGEQLRHRDKSDGGCWSALIKRVYECFVHFGLPSGV